MFVGLGETIAVNNLYWAVEKMVSKMTSSSVVRMLHTARRLFVQWVGVGRREVDKWKGCGILAVVLGRTRSLQC